jgi:hypothetical protein
LLDAGREAVGTSGAGTELGGGARAGVRNEGAGVLSPPIGCGVVAGTAGGVGEGSAGVRSGVGAVSVPDGWGTGDELSAPGGEGGVPIIRTPRVSSSPAF